ncbi:hypothetical protein EG68_11578 [Paragonimus skrjabini miyazakii]|uniref:Uncharacterized protein n=1 Tax=Paragonimus skrjabini miyazakii TaxID=59628 RepID=A0A8S9YEB5_9TREM|nr:hypothetical protein EG68_11578 [Paragonimus skrjabini miyazakii]
MVSVITTSYFQVVGYMVDWCWISDRVEHVILGLLLSYFPNPFVPYSISHDLKI